MLRTIEKYEILEEIGHGGMATVFRARDTKLDRLVALKVMHPHLRASREARARFRREAQGVAKLRHPRVLEIYDYSGEDSEESYIATELLTGPTLKKFADDHPVMPAEIAACFAIEVCRALGAAHDKGIVHRDVKPENILVHHAPDDGPWCVKLTDFGIADMVDSQTMTATGQILGSPGHMSPEQIEGKDCDARTDVFSLGTVLYFLACGKLPFTGRNPHQVLKRIVDGDFADPQRVQPAIGGRLRAIIVRALAHDADQRFASAADLEKELRAFVAEIGIADAESLLADYLADSERVTTEITKQTISACTALGRKARDAGDVPAALDHFGRVLALDNGNAEVLALVESVGRVRRRRSALAISVGAFALASSIVGIGLVVGPAFFGPEDPGPIAVGAPPPDAGPRPADAARTLALGVAADDAGALAAAQERDGGPRIEITATKLTRRPEIMPIAGGPPRRVTFRIEPMNVRIGVDDGLPRQYGPQFQHVELEPGAHRFVIEADCCETARFTLSIPPGETDYVLERRLESQPALLIVNTGGVPADVVVGAGLARGRANDPISVPISSPTYRDRFEFTVTAPGRPAYTGRVDLAAGRPRTETVTLSAAEPPPG